MTGCGPRLRLDGALRRRDGRARARRDRAAPARQRRCAPRRRTGVAPAGEPEPGHDDRVGRHRSRGASQRTGQDAGTSAGDPRGCRRTRDPVHHGDPRRHRRLPRRPARRARSDRREPSSPRARAGGDRPELPAEGTHGDARRSRVPERRLPVGGRGRPADPAERRAPAGAAEPHRRLRCAARRGHRRLGRCLAGHRRPREPGTARGPTSTSCGRSPRRRGMCSHRASPCIPSSSPTARAGSIRRCTSPSWTAPTPSGSDATIRDRSGPSRPPPPTPSPTAPSSCSSVTARPPGTPVPTTRRRCLITELVPASRTVSLRRARWPTCSPGSTPVRNRVSTRSSRCSKPADPRSSPSPPPPTGCGRDLVGDTLTWVANRNINYTNVCTFKCRFCGFSKGPLSLNLRGTPYLLTLDDIAERAREGLGDGCHRGDPARWHPPELRRRLLHRRHHGP